MVRSRYFTHHDFDMITPSLEKVCIEKDSLRWFDLHCKFALSPSRVLFSPMWSRDVVVFQAASRPGDPLPLRRPPHSHRCPGAEVSHRPAERSKSRLLRGLFFESSKCIMTGQHSWKRPARGSSSRGMTRWPSTRTPWWAESSPPPTPPPSSGFSNPRILPAGLLK